MVTIRVLEIPGWNSTEALEALKRLYPEETTFTIIKRSPMSPEEWLQDSKKLGKDIFTFLPAAEPFPTLSIRNGYRHLVVSEGILLEITGVTVSTQPFKL